MNLKISAFALCIILFTQSSYAQLAGKVKAAQFPGWVERGDQIIAIKPGLDVQQGDVIHTGLGGKLLLSMNDGSDIKLGNSSQIDIRTVENADPQNDNVFGMALSVLKGVFRFTTAALGQKTKRDIAISFGTVTAGIRGTDIWGRSNQENDLVCLLEGEIDVSHPLSDTINLDEARQYYDANKGEAGALKGKVDEAQIQKWALSTELDIAQGVMHEDGQWAVVVMSLNNIEHAKIFVNSLNNHGYPAQIQSTELNDITYHRVIIPYFNTSDDAVHARRRLNGVKDIENAWVKKYMF